MRGRQQCGERSERQPGRRLLLADGQFAPFGQGPQQLLVPLFPGGARAAVEEDGEAEIGGGAQLRAVPAEVHRHHHPGGARGEVREGGGGLRDQAGVGAVQGPPLPARGPAVADARERGPPPWRGRLTVGAAEGVEQGEVVQRGRGPDGCLSPQRPEHVRRPGECAPRVHDRVVHAEDQRGGGALGADGHLAAAAVAGGERGSQRRTEPVHGPYGGGPPGVRPDPAPAAQACPGAGLGRLVDRPAQRVGSDRAGALDHDLDGERRGEPAAGQVEPFGG
ncbi:MULTISPECIES: hypothetical protein [Streptomyces]|uniref:hypothetical protein n=1 Tax=Streptomyces TaxID=1883 RepID=UPI00341D8C94